MAAPSGVYTMDWGPEEVLLSSEQWLDTYPPYCIIVLLLKFADYKVTVLVSRIGMQLCQIGPSYKSLS